MKYEIEVIKTKSKTTYNALKKESTGEEVGYITDSTSIQEAVERIRIRWKHKGPIKVTENNLVVETIPGE